jgi:DNA-3-methyladenine glycosylase II
MSAHRLSLALALPPHFRADDILTFHRRDREELAESARDDRLRKGLLWRGVPACLEIVFTPTQAAASLEIDGPASPDDAARFEALVARMLGLTQTVDAFEARYAAHPELGPLLARQRGLRVPVAASPFEALVWAIIGQQISVHAAISIRRKLILATGERHHAGLYCHPDAPRLAATPEDALRAAGLTGSKAATVRAISAATAEGRLPLTAWSEALPAVAAEQLLLAQRGIGPWTVNYTLLRGYGYLDGSLHGDVAVRRGLQQLLNAPERPDAARAADWLAQFSPWRALVAAHLWAAGG